MALPFRRIQAVDQAAGFLPEFVGEFSISSTIALTVSALAFSSSAFRLSKSVDELFTGIRLKTSESFGHSSFADMSV